MWLEFYCRALAIASLLFHQFLLPIIINAWFDLQETIATQEHHEDSRAPPILEVYVHSWAESPRETITLGMAIPTPLHQNSTKIAFHRLVLLSVLSFLPACKTDVCVFIQNLMRDIHTHHTHTHTHTHTVSPYRG